jgi:hypothetical protein
VGVGYAVICRGDWGGGVHVADALEKWLRLLGVGLVDHMLCLRRSYWILHQVR